MKYYIIVVLSGFLAITCNKSVEKEKLYLRGRLFLLDTITTSIRYQPLASKKITLSNQPADSLNYLYSTKTDAEGYFLFDLLEDQKDDPFIVRYEDSIGGFRYVARAEVKNGNDTIRLIAHPDTTHLNGFIVLVKDSLEPAGNIPHATLAIYNSKLLAENNDDKGAVETITADSTGMACKFKLPPGTYYLNAQLEAGSLNLQRIAKPMIVQASGISRDTIQLRKK